MMPHTACRRAMPLGAAIDARDYVTFTRSAFTELNICHCCALWLSAFHHATLRHDATTHAHGIDTLMPQPR